MAVNAVASGVIPIGQPLVARFMDQHSSTSNQQQVQLPATHQMNMMGGHPGYVTPHRADAGVQYVMASTQSQSMGVGVGVGVGVGGQHTQIGGAQHAQHAGRPVMVQGQAQNQNQNQNQAQAYRLVPINGVPMNRSFIDSSGRVVVREHGQGGPMMPTLIAPGTRKPEDGKDLPEGLPPTAHSAHSAQVPNLLMPAATKAGTVDAEHANKRMRLGHPTATVHSSATGAGAGAAVLGAGVGVLNAPVSTAGALGLGRIVHSSQGIPVDASTGMPLQTAMVPAPGQQANGQQRYEQVVLVNDHWYTLKQ